MPNKSPENIRGTSEESLHSALSSALFADLTANENQVAEETTTEEETSSDDRAKLKEIAAAHDKARISVEQHGGGID